MTPGTILFEAEPTATVATFLHDELADVALIFEAIAGADAAGIRHAEALWKTAIAALSTQLGQPDQTPTRAQGIAGPPATIDPRWTKAALWDREATRIVATLSGAEGGALEVGLCRGAI